MLNISMPGGASTAVVVLDVPVDLWVKRTYSNGAVPKVDDPDFWTVCVRIETYGLGLNGRLNYAVLELDGQILKPLGQDFGIGTLSDQGTGDGYTTHCATYVWLDAPQSGVSASTPRPIKFAVLLAAEEASMTGPEWGEPEAPETPINPFAIHVGIGTRPCIAGYTASPFDIQQLGGTAHDYCGPTEVSAIEPLQRTSSNGTSSSFQSNLPCDACGFIVDDQRQPLGAASFGLLRAERHEAGTHLIYAFGAMAVPVIGTGAVSADTVTLYAEMDGKQSSISCTGASFSVFLLGASRTTANISIEWSARGAGVFFAGTRSLPMDLDALGWQMPTTMGLLTPSFDRFGDPPCPPNP